MEEYQVKTWGKQANFFNMNRSITSQYVRSRTETPMILTDHHESDLRGPRHLNELRILVDLTPTVVGHSPVGQSVLPSLLDGHVIEKRIRDLIPNFPNLTRAGVAFPWQKILATSERECHCGKRTDHRRETFTDNNRG
jgi:hypothetical protein